MGGQQVEAVRRIVERLGPDVRVVLVDLPVTDVYVALHPRPGDYARYRVMLRRLATDLDVALVDAESAIRGRLFADANHLNKLGSAAFSRLLDGELQALLPRGGARSRMQPAADVGRAEPAAA